MVEFSVPGIVSSLADITLSVAARNDDEYTKPVLTVMNKLKMNSIPADKRNIILHNIRMDYFIRHIRLINESISYRSKVTAGMNSLSVQQMNV